MIVVDDDASIRGALRQTTTDFGIQRNWTLASAEEFLASELPTGNACLLLDVYMPAMTGIELCRKMTESGRRLPTILISGRDDPQTRKIIREAKPIASLLKPFDEKSLLRAIRKALPDQSNLPD